MISRTVLVHLWWYGFLFLVGAASTAVEITGLRFLAPLFGSSLPVWGSAIATVLAGLSWGYARGGKRAQRGVTPQVVVQHGALAAALFLLLPVLFRVTTRLRSLALASDNPLLAAGTLVVPILTLLIPSIAFGMTTPLAVQAEATRRGENAGQVAGRISALTTLGSLAGIVLPSFLTIPLLGTQGSVWLFAGLVLLASLPLLNPTKHLTATVWLILIGVTGAIIPFPRNPSVLFSAETPHQHVTVVQFPGQRLLQYDAGHGIQSLYTEKLYTGGYWDYLAALPALLPRREPAVETLILGAAASTTERQMHRWWEPTTTLHFTSVELDRALFPIAEQYFDPPPRTTIASDARVFVTQDTKRYDIVVLDAYSRELTVPFHLVTVEFFELLKDRLAPQGIVAINANAAYADTLWLRSLTTTLQRVFPHVQLISLPASCNHLLLAATAPWEMPTVINTFPEPVAALLPTLAHAQPAHQAGLILTDDRAPTDLLGLLALSQRSRTPACT